MTGNWHVLRPTPPTKARSWTADSGATPATPTTSGTPRYGGAMFTTDEALAQKMKSIRSHGQEKKYYYQYVGLNSRLDTLQAAILNVKMKAFPEECNLRDAAGARYTELLKNKSYLKTPIISEGNYKSNGIINLDINLTQRFMVGKQGLDKFNKQIKEIRWADQEPIQLTGSGNNIHITRNIDKAKIYSLVFVDGNGCISVEHY